MTPKEAAKELVFKFYHLKKRPLISFWRDISYAKACAIIHVNGIIDELDAVAQIEAITDDTIIYQINEKIEFFNDVLNQIQSL